MIRNIVKFLQVAIALLLSLVLLFNLALIFDGVISKSKMPTAFGISQAIVVTGSMEPTISAGDVAIYREVEEYGIGDIIIFSQGKEVVTHRIIETAEDGYITKGDANNVADLWVVAPDSIFGKLLLVVPNLGTFANFLKTGKGAIFIIIMIVAIVQVPMIYDRYIAKRRKDEQDEKYYR